MIKAMGLKRNTIIFTIVSSTLIAIFSNPSLASYGDVSKIETAENAVREAFKVVVEAEKAGADISHLLSRLRDAGVLLEEAETYYRNGDINQSTNIADEVISRANETAVDAIHLEDSAIVDSLNVFWVTLAFSTIGGLVFVLALILVWFWFKARYVKKLLKAKPEVIRC